MNKISALACGILSLCALGTSFASETPERAIPESRYAKWMAPAIGVPDRSRSNYIGYYSTLRYYSKDYTVRYGFVPVNRSALRRITEIDPVLLSANHPIRPADSTRVVIGEHHASTGPVFRSTKKVISVKSEDTQAVPAAAAAEKTTTTTTSTTTVTVPGTAIPLQPALPAPAETSIQPVK